MNHALKTLADIGDLRGRRILMRTSLNVPIKDEVVVDDFRLQRVLPTITYAREANARVVLIAHRSGEHTRSLRAVADYLKAHFPISFVEDFTSDEGKTALSKMRDGEVVLLENIRRFPGEEANDILFAKQIAEIGDLYVNEDFASSHREHASIVSVPTLLPSVAGFVFAEEVVALSAAFSPEHPFVSIIGGAKGEIKLPLVQSLTTLSDTVFVGGALANTLLKARGREVGTSVVSGALADAEKLVANEKVVIPIDVVVDGAEGGSEKSIDAVLPDERIVDIGSRSLKELSHRIKQARFVLWNGPLGHYEDGFDTATKQLAHMLAQSDADTVVGGGDTLAAIKEEQVSEQFTFLSTAGGAMVTFLTNRTLPGIEALKKSS